MIREPEWFEHRVFKGPDTNINLHVFSAGCEETDRMVLFRDWLRSNDDDRARYAAAKRELAARDWKYVQQYADAKTAIVAEIMSNAEAGARAATVKVHVISDMEGVAGIVKWEQTTGGDPMYEEGRRLYTEEINAAVRGAKAAGATEIVVMDCHGAGRGWSFNSLDPRPSRPGLRVRRAAGVDGVHGASSSRGATRRSSSACTHAPARATAS